MEDMQIEGISAERGLELCEGDEDFYRFKLQMFADYIPEQIANCRQYLAEEDYKSYVVEIHSMKGAALGIGADRLSARAKAQEFAGKENRLDEIHRDAEEVLTSFEEMVEKLRTYLAE